ncbi:hypothetical protein BDD14_3810 [Edaphobacter modestus]|uniref:Uncharacterized protein n=1 Tax=Edaphobacter modestus TaxID=388466 RepID=A0A4V2G4U1_9BACT|nr:hypothetical protein BDD14_3810 [Edaphobacter modestus]
MTVSFSRFKREMQTRRSMGRCAATRHLWRGMVMVKDCFVPVVCFDVFSKSDSG